MQITFVMIGVITVPAGGPLTFQHLLQGLLMDSLKRLVHVL
jgi:hypothetical protein